MIQEDDSWAAEEVILHKHTVNPFVLGGAERHHISIQFSSVSSEELYPVHLDHRPS